MISHRHRCIYVKVPKCASTTILSWFLEHGEGRHSFRPAWHAGPMAKRIPDVTQALNLYPDYFVFTFVRDPYERFVSLWLDLTRVVRRRNRSSSPVPPDFETLRGFAELCVEILEDFRPCWGEDAIEAFRARREREYGTGRVRLGDLGWSIDHLWPQTAFLPDCNPSRLFGIVRTDPERPSFLGRVDHLASDFAELACVLELPDAALPRRNAGVLKNERGAYAAYYDAGTRRLVESLYASDFEYIERAFDTGTSSVAAPVRIDAWPLVKTVKKRPRRTLMARLCRVLWTFEARTTARLLQLRWVRTLVEPLAIRRGPG